MEKVDIRHSRISGTYLSLVGVITSVRFKTTHPDDDDDGAAVDVAIV